MPVLFCGILLGLLLAVFFLTFLGYFKIHSLIAKKKARELSTLQEYHHRVKLIVSHLLSQANEIDQASKYLANPPDSKWSTNLAESCSHLVVLGNKLGKTESFIAARDIRATRESIIFCLNESFRLHRQLSNSKRYIIRSKNSSQVNNQ